MRTVHKLFAFMIACGLIGFPALAAADEKPGTVRITVLGPDGKPVKDPPTLTVDVGTQDRYDYGEDDYGEDDDGEGFDPKVKGRVVRVYSGLGLRLKGETTIFVPDGQEMPVTVQIKYASFDHGVEDAILGKNTGNANLQQQGYDEAKAATAQAEQTVKETRNAIEAWARENGLPIMKLSAVRKQVELADRLGEKQDKEQADKLRSYKAKLESLEKEKSRAAGLKERLAELPQPEKKVSGLPGPCPEGQSGGLLAGLLNTVTGTNSFAGICDDDEKQKDSRDRQRDYGDKDHGKD